MNSLSTALCGSSAMCLKRQFIGHVSHPEHGQIFILAEENKSYKEAVHVIQGSVAPEDWRLLAEYDKMRYNHLTEEQRRGWIRGATLKRPTSKPSHRANQERCPWVLQGRVHYSVDYISGVRFKVDKSSGNVTLEFYVHWLGCSKTEDSWEDREALKNCHHACAVFEASIFSDKPDNKISAEQFRQQIQKTNDIVAKMEIVPQTKLLMQVTNDESLVNLFNEPSQIRALKLVKLYKSKNENRKSKIGNKSHQNTRATSSEKSRAQQISVTRAQLQIVTGGSGSETGSGIEELCGRSLSCESSRSSHEPGEQLHMDLSNPGIQSEWNYINSTPTLTDPDTHNSENKSPPMSNYWTNRQASLANLLAQTGIQIEAPPINDEEFESVEQSVMAVMSVTQVVLAVKSVTKSVVAVKSRETVTEMKMPTPLPLVPRPHSAKCKPSDRMDVFMKWRCELKRPAGPCGHSGDDANKSLKMQVETEQLEKKLAEHRKEADGVNRSRKMQVETEQLEKKQAEHRKEADRVVAALASSRAAKRKRTCDEDKVERSKDEEAKSATKVSNLNLDEQMELAVHVSQEEAASLAAKPKGTHAPTDSLFAPTCYEDVKDEDEKESVDDDAPTCSEYGEDEDEEDSGDNEDEEEECKEGGAKYTTKISEMTEAQLMDMACKLSAGISGEVGGNATKTLNEAKQIEEPIEGIEDTGKQVIMVVISAEEIEMEACEVQPLDPDDHEFVKECAELSLPPINIYKEHSYSTTQL